MSGLWVRHRADSAAAVRDSVRCELSAAGVPADAVYDATLITSELLSNAVRHAPPLPSGELGVRWSIQSGQFNIAVTDGGPVTRLDADLPADEKLSGRGLAIVATIADSWGVDDAGETNTVWAVYSLADPQPSADLVTPGGNARSPRGSR